MITESVKNLFSFIDFLHSNTAYFLSKQNLVDKVMELHTKRNSLKPNQNFKDRIEYNKVQAEFEKEWDVLKRETTIVIVEKVQELNIADLSTPSLNLNAQGDLFELQRNFSEKGLPEIFEAKRKYLEFRTKTNFHYSLELFFHDLYRNLKEFFDYFKETTENEFEAFETKTVKVNSIEEAVKLFQKGIKSVSLPIDFLNPSKVQQNEYEREKQSWQIKQRPSSEKDIIQQIIERIEIHDFLTVPAPDVLHENAFWHDENDLPIDCNIYHHKYGYKGFETTTKEPIVTSFQPVTVYTDERTGKYIYCQYYWPMLCLDEGTFYNKDGEKVIKVNWTQTNQKRLAENEQDFSAICQREFEKQKLTETPETKRRFYLELINHTKELIELHEKRSNYKDGRDINVLGLADRFISFVQEQANRFGTNEKASKTGFSGATKFDNEQAAKPIQFKGLETIKKLHDELKDFFPGKESELLKAMNGEQLKEPLFFPHNQNKFVEVFKRAKYNELILSKPTEIKNWICSNFLYRKKRGNKITVEPFKENSVWDILTKDKGEPTQKERICKCDWLPYKSHLQRQRETEKEKR